MFDVDSMIRPLNGIFYIPKYRVDPFEIRMIHSVIPASHYVGFMIKTGLRVHENRRDHLKEPGLLGQDDVLPSARSLSYENLLPWKA